MGGFWRLVVISTGRDTRHPGVETRDATQHPAVPRTPCHPACVSLVPGLGGPCSGLRLLPGESPGSPDCATLGRAGSGVGGKRLPEPRGWVDWARWAPLGRDPHLFSSCFSPAPGTESQPESSWGRSWARELRPETDPLGGASSQKIGHREVTHENGARPRT